MAEPNAVRGEFSFALGDHEFTMVPSFQNIARIESGLGRSILALSGELSAGRGVTLAELVLIIDNLAKKPKPSRDEIGDMLMAEGVLAGMPVLETLITRVVGGSRRASAEGNEANPASAG